MDDDRLLYRDKIHMSASNRNEGVEGGFFSATGTVIDEDTASDKTGSSTVHSVGEMEEHSSSHYEPSISSSSTSASSTSSLHASPPPAAPLQEHDEFQYHSVPYYVDSTATSSSRTSASSTYNKYYHDYATITGAGTVINSNSARRSNPMASQITWDELEDTVPATGSRSSSSSRFGTTPATTSWWDFGLFGNPTTALLLAFLGILFYRKERLFWFQGRGVSGGDWHFYQYAIEWGLELLDYSRAYTQMAVEFVRSVKGVVFGVSAVDDFPFGLAAPNHHNHPNVMLQERSLPPSPVNNNNNQRRRRMKNANGYENNNTANQTNAMPELEEDPKTCVTNKSTSAETNVNDTRNVATANIASIVSTSNENDSIEPAFLKDEDYPPGWLVYHPVLGVVAKPEADRYQTKLQEKQAQRLQQEQEKKRQRQLELRRQQQEQQQRKQQQQEKQIQKQQQQLQQQQLQQQNQQQRTASAPQLPPAATFIQAHA